MRLLLDTHAFLWFLLNDPQLTAKARRLIEDGANEIVVSMASLWEMAIKISLGKLQIGQPYDTFIPQQLALNSIGVLDISVNHTAEILNLPFHHRDPFDRLLIAQAHVEQIAIISVDSVFDAYGVIRLW